MLAKQIMRVQIVFRVIALAAFSVALTGCIHYEHQSAEGKPAAQVATIQQLDKHLVITKIDDKSTLFWLSRQSEYQLGAGTHKLTVAWYFGENSTGGFEKTVNLVGGRTYGMSGEMFKDRWTYDIRDSETGQSAVVAKP